MVGSRHHYNECHDVRTKRQGKNVSVSDESWGRDLWLWVVSQWPHVAEVHGVWWVWTTYFSFSNLCCALTYWHCVCVRFRNGFKVVTDLLLGLKVLCELCFTDFYTIDNRRYTFFLTKFHQNFVVVTMPLHWNLTFYLQWMAIAIVSCFIYHYTVDNR